MSEYHTSSIEGYTETSAVAVAAEAGLSHAVAGVTAAAAGLVGAGFVGIARLAQALDRAVQKKLSEAEEAGDCAGRMGIPGPAPRTGLDLKVAFATLEVLGDGGFWLLKEAVAAESRIALPKLRALLEPKGIGNEPSIVKNPRDAAAEFSRALARGAGRILHAERDVLRRTVSATLKGMGYRVGEPRHPPAGVVILKGTSGKDRSVFVRLDPARGEIHMDFAGFSGTDCVSERERFLKGLEANGVRLRTLEKVLHGAKEGGLLAQELECLFAKIEAPGEWEYQGTEISRVQPRSLRQEGSGR